MIEHLAKQISERIADKKFCTVFENKLAQVWPVRSKEWQKRKDEIHAFAKERGWKVKITDPGLRATFRKLDDAPHA